MRKLIYILMILLGSANFLYSQTNDFYDDAETVDLGMPEITIEGEVAHPGKADLTALPLHTVIVKETEFGTGKGKFTGAYRFDGYSLHDMLNNILLQKNNEKEFPPMIDLIVIVENAYGNKVVFSWGELFYAVHLNEILIATRVARIVPAKTKELWPLPKTPHLVAAADLFTERNLNNPKKITIKSYDRKLAIDKGLRGKPAPVMVLKKDENTLMTLETLPETLTSVTYPAIFYGHGTGIHSTTPFQGVLLKSVLEPYIPLTADLLKTGYLVLNGKDGYHGVFSASEVFNRNDQSETLLYTTEGEYEGGKFKIYPSADFFSDRAIKSLETIFVESISKK